MTQDFFYLHPDNRRIFIWRERGNRNNRAFVRESVRFASEVMIYAGIFIEGRTELQIIRNGAVTGRKYKD